MVVTKLFGVNEARYRCANRAHLTGNGWLAQGSKVCWLVAPGVSYGFISPPTFSKKMKSGCISILEFTL